MSNVDRILALVRARPGMDDDQISAQLDIRPRQQVNQICRRLEARGAIRRVRGAGGKIVNVPEGADAGQMALLDPPPRLEFPVSQPRYAPSRAAAAVHVRLDHTLVIITCSAGKRREIIEVASGPTILDDLPSGLAARLRHARAAVRGGARVDESTMLPAWRRYSGLLFQEGGDALEAAVSAGVRIVILSGGYGVCRADEPIGDYDRRYDSGDWPDGLVEDCLASLAADPGVEDVVGIAGTSTPYAAAIRGTRWPVANGRAHLMSPRPTQGTNPQRAVPVASGELLSELLMMARVEPSWRGQSGCGVSIEALPTTG